MPWDVSFLAQGEQFTPGRVVFAFEEAHDPGAIGRTGRYRGGPTPYGWAVYRVPPHIRNPINHLADVILPILPEIRRAGATNSTVDVARYYSGQCNEELSAEEIAVLAELECTFTYFAYDVTPADEAEMMQRLGGFDLPAE